jgi:hypothetical protein
MGDPIRCRLSILYRTSRPIPSSRLGVPGQVWRVVFRINSVILDVATRYWRCRFLETNDSVQGARGGERDLV